MLTVHGSIASRDAHGGTAPDRVAEQTDRLVDAVAATAAGRHPPAPGCHLDS